MVRKKREMMKIIKIITTLISCLCISNTYAQTSHSITATTKASATLASVCTLAAQNVSFGQVVLPVSNQVSTSNMTVQCTKGSTYTIALAYGGVYGQGGTTNLPLTLNSGRNGYAYCVYSATINGQLYQTSTNYGQTCADSVSYTIPSYSYGMMVGGASGDAISYSIQVPNQPTQIWNNGNYSYTSTGTGANQSIPVVTTLQPSNTSNKYPTPDNYVDTVKATVNF